MFSVAPSGDGISDAVDDLFFIGDEMCPGIPGIKVIEYEDTFWLQGGADHADGVPILPAGLEITKAGEEIKSIPEAVGTKKLPHIVYIEMQMVVLRLPGNGDIAGRQIDTGNVIAMGREHPRMTASATCDIEQAGTGWGL